MFQIPSLAIFSLFSVLISFKKFFYSFVFLEMAFPAAKLHFHIIFSNISWRAWDQKLFWLLQVNRSQKFPIFLGYLIFDKFNELILFEEASTACYENTNRKQSSRWRREDQFACAQHLLGFKPFEDFPLNIETISKILIIHFIKLINFHSPFVCILFVFALLNLFLVHLFQKDFVPL